MYLSIQEFINMSKKHIIGLFLAIICTFSAKAQFTGMGSEPTTVKWSQINTKNYKVIYPRGLDSLARVYATSLEQTALSVGSSVGYAPNQMYKRPMPVVLHPYTAYSNGQVAWTPRQVDLYTVPDAFSPSTQPWEKHLVLHESRHVAQMQYNTDGIFKLGKYLTGELLAGALAAVYCGRTFFEGDAVVAETAMSAGGRGRSADFLEHYRYHITTENKRDYYQWKYSSQKTFIPDYYRLGYLHFAGLRAIYDAPDFTAQYFQNIKKSHGISFLNFSKTTKQVSGLNKYKSFEAIADSLKNFWLADNASRAPFMQAQAHTNPDKKYSEYTDLVAAESCLFAVKTSIVDIPKIVKIQPDGKSETIARIGNMHSPLKYCTSTGEIVWSEYTPDPRWEMRSFAEIRSMDSNGTVRTLLHSRWQRYFNPDPHPYEPLIAVVTYPEYGGSHIKVITAQDGDAIATYASPTSMQYLAPLWVGDQLYASAITEDGIGIFRVSDGAVVLEPSASNIERLFAEGERIYFSSDVSGVRELYSISVDGADLRQHSVLENGGGDFLMSGDSLYFTELGANGRSIMKISIDKILSETSALEQRNNAYPFINELVAQESPIDYQADVALGEVKPYSKFAHSFNLHSWVPIYLDPDAVSQLSFSSLTTAASLGATAFFQNTLGTLSGTVAYKAFQNGGFRSSGHMSLKYNGMYPVVEVKAYYNTRDAIEYSKQIVDNRHVLKNIYLNKPMFMTDISTYIPLNFSRSGLNVGLIPKLEFVLSNDKYTHGTEQKPMTRMMASIRAYAVQSIPNSRIYPRWGVGAEFAFSSRPWVYDVLSPASYAYLYAYTPGLHSTHGFKFTALYENSSQNAIFSEVLSTNVPRGYSSASNLSVSYFRHKLRFTVDYAMPIIPIEWSGLKSIAYLRNLELIPYFDFSLYSDGSRMGSLYSAGADFILRLGNFAMLPYDTRVGLSFNYLGGSFFNSLHDMGAENKPFSLSLVFSVDV